PGRHGRSTFLRSIGAVASARNPNDFPRADHAQATLTCLDPDEYGADAGTGGCRRSPECADCVRQSLATTTRSIPDLSDEQAPLAVDDVPGVGPAQLCNAQRVHDAACICLRVDIGHPPAVTSGERPHWLHLRVV